MLKVKKPDLSFIELLNNSMLKGETKKNYFWKKKHKKTLLIGWARKLCNHEYKINIVSYKEKQGKKFEWWN
jgi:hypothetical protein